MNTDTLIPERRDRPCRGFCTPWGMAQHATEYAPGIVFYSTASHGGFKLSKSRLAELHAKLGPVKLFRDFTQWFEEDCDWSHVALAFPDLFTADEMETAKAIRASMDKS